MNRVLKGSGGYDVAYRVDGDRILKGNSGYDVAYRIDGDRILVGNSGYDVAYRIDGDRILVGNSGYDVGFRLDQDNEHDDDNDSDIEHISGVTDKETVGTQKNCHIDMAEFNYAATDGVKDGITIRDLCGSCLSMTTESGLSVGKMLEVFYTDPRKHMEWGEMHVLKALSNTIIMGDGCTTCGEKIQNRIEKLLGITRPVYNESSGGESGILKKIIIVVVVVGLLWGCTTCLVSML